MEEATISLNTRDVGVDTVVTPLIKGELECMIISVEEGKQIEMKIVLSKHPEVIIFHNRETRGVSYLPLRVQAISDKHEGFNYSHEKWFLNDELRIDIRGGKYIKVDVTIRWQNK